MRSIRCALAAVFSALLLALPARGQETDTDMHGTLTKLLLNLSHSSI